MQFLKQMPQLLHFQTLFGNPCILRSYGFLEIPQFVVKAGKFGSLLFKLGLSNVMSILGMSVRNIKTQTRLLSSYLNPCLLSLERFRLFHLSLQGGIGFGKLLFSG